MTGTSRAGAARAIAVLLLLAVAVRLLMIFAAPAELLGEQNYVSEELCRGNLAYDLVHGLLLPVQDYQVNSYSGGTVVIGVVAAPLFAVLGDSLVALRLATLPFLALAVASGFLLVDRAFGRRAAWWAGLLLCLPPPGYALIGSMALGTHVENTGFALLFLLLTTLPFTRPRALLAGFVLGFGVAFGYGILVFLAVVAARAFLVDRRFLLRRPVLLGALMVPVGLAPWLRYNALHDFAGLRLYGRGVAEHAESASVDASLLERLWSLLVHDGPHALWFGNDLVGGLVLAALLAGAGVALAGYRRGERGPLVVLCAYSALFAALMVASGRDLGNPAWVQNHRYLLQLYPYVALAAGVGLARLSARAPRAAPAGLALLLATNLGGTLAVSDPDHVGDAWARPGRSALVFGRFAGERLPAEPEERVALVERIVARRDRAEQDDIFFRLGMTCRAYATLPGPADDVRTAFYRAALAHLEDLVPAEFAPYFRLPPRGHARVYGKAQKEAFWAAEGGPGGRRPGSDSLQSADDDE